jgi:hypothetical protein
MVAQGKGGLLGGTQAGQNLQHAGGMLAGLGGELGQIQVHFHMLAPGRLLDLD